MGANHHVTPNGKKKTCNHSPFKPDKVLQYTVYSIHNYSQLKPAQMPMPTECLHGMRNLRTIFQSILLASPTPLQLERLPKRGVKLLLHLAHLHSALHGHCRNSFGGQKETDYQLPTNIFFPDPNEKLYGL